VAHQEASQKFEIYLEPELGGTRRSYIGQTTNALIEFVALLSARDY
jgi:hypothetical protein